MEAKCPKCENTSFQIVKREDKLFCYVCCKECGTVIGVLEDIDFKKRYDKIINNHVFFERKINDLEEKLDKLTKEQSEILDTVEAIYSKQKIIGS